jgi:hypothetical protein
MAILSQKAEARRILEATDGKVEAHLARGRQKDLRFLPPFSIAAWRRPRRAG